MTTLLIPDKKKVEQQKDITEKIRRSGTKK
jgi:hypothetical protein